MSPQVTYWSSRTLDRGTLLHARTEIERWRREYNEERPKDAIGGMTPAAYARHLANIDIINPGL